MKICFKVLIPSSLNNVCDLTLKMMMSSVQLWWNQQPNLGLKVECVLTKQGQRFLKKVMTSGDPSATNNLIRRFVQNSPKSVSLTTLYHLLSPSSLQPHVSSLAFPLYARIAEAPWYSWNPKIVAQLAALLDKQEQYAAWETLISEASSKLESCSRDLALFYCKLLECHSRQSSERGFGIAYSYLSQLLHISSSSMYIKRRIYECMVSSLCSMDRPCEAENLVKDMRIKGLEPSPFEFKSIMYGYGRLGLIQDLERILVQMEKEEFAIDTVCSNMVLSAYGIHGERTKMALWLQRMRNSSIPFSIRTYNSVLNSCAVIMRKLVDLNGFPLSIEELNASLERDEAMVVQELMRSTMILEEVMVWGSKQAKLDLHGLHLGSSYLIMLLWLEEMRRRLNGDSSYAIPAEIVVVCGSGKHSSVRGESPVKMLVKEMMVKMRSPLRIDRKNNGCFVAKGKAVRDWLLRHELNQ
ncbi:pentatricopeptide repeat-containing protein At2g17033 isoform X2 [Prosopis cineraria]|uniref:pentatricopeptide repeat-containing protein At2g17033 isoform X2 n=1 Tax=Prosopis cineraria TaxID=364024 RepID=UPI00240F2BEA|nr:pentatricopeptide repeat-containing protein At2g17033 isoform X2 [Prosopis cineraria]